MEMEKSSFVKGLLSGVALTCIIGLLVLLGSSLFSPQTQDTPTNDKETPEAIVAFEERVLDKIETLMNYIDRYCLYDADEDAILAGIASGVMSAVGDPYTVYYDKEAYQSLMESTTGSYYGIGVQVQQNMNTMTTEIVTVFDNSPAKESGLRSGDIFVSVGDVDVTAMDLNELVALIKGEEGTKVEVTVYRESEEDYLTFEVERRQVEVTTVKSQMLENQIGYIRVTEFDTVTVGQFDDAYAALKAQGMEGLVIDLRNNPGGSLDTVVKMCDKFLDEGMITYMENKDKERIDEYHSDAAAETVPMVVLVDGGSASASEIFAGAMKDRDRAEIVGTTTYGKGIVQSIVPLPGGDSDAIKITISSYFTPGGVCIHGIGVTPDYEVELDEDYMYDADMPMEDDNQLQKALEILMQKMEK